MTDEAPQKMVASSVLEMLILEIKDNAEKIGYETGYRYVEKVLSQRTIGVETLEVMKFLCKEFWFEIFGKHVDKLQTNHRGVFVLRESYFAWIARTSSSDEELQNATAIDLLRFPSGLLQGALANCGIHAQVSCFSSATDTNKSSPQGATTHNKLSLPLPGCAFNIKILSSPS